MSQTTQVSGPAADDLSQVVGGVRKFGAELPAAIIVISAVAGLWVLGRALG